MWHVGAAAAATAAESAAEDVTTEVGHSKCQVHVWFTADYIKCLGWCPIAAAAALPARV
jgi:hypothetical protein